MTDSLLAIDIETMPVVDDPDFQDPSHWRVLAIALGSVAPTTEQQTAVLLRRSDSQHAEAMLLDRAIRWLKARDASTICTYNGSRFDFPILRHRARKTIPPDIKFQTSVASRLDRMLNDHAHRDLFQEICNLDNPSTWLSLEDACHEHDIELSSARYEKKIVTGGDVPRLGAKILDVATDSGEEEQVLRDYATEDVRPLLELAKKVDKEVTT